MGTFGQYLIICPLVFLAGLVDSIAGGGGLISLPAYVLAGFPMLEAIGTNKMSSCMGTAVSTLNYSAGGLIPWKKAAVFTAFAFGGSALGARLALLTGDAFFRKFMLFAIPAVLLYVLFGKGVTEAKEPYPDGKTLLIGSAVSLACGVYDGFYGPGTGTFLILLLTGLAHMDPGTANGTSKAINLATNAAALTVYLISGTARFPIGAVAGLFGIAGNWIGSSFVKKKGAAFVRPVMAAVIALFILKIVTES